MDFLILLPPLIAILLMLFAIITGSLMIREELLLREKERQRIAELVEKGRLSYLPTMYPHPLTFGVLSATNGDTISHSV